MPDTLESIAREMLENAPMYMSGDFSYCSHCDRSPEYQGHKKNCIILRLQRVLGKGPKDAPSSAED